MKVFISLIILFCASLTLSATICKIPEEGPHLGRDKECVALVQHNCPKIGNTRINWRRGIRVKDNCDIPRGTAIATFAGPNNTYNGKFRHAAIFDKCVNETGKPYGIQVWDQYNSSKGVRSRILKYGNRHNSSNGDNFYVITSVNV